MTSLLDKLQGFFSKTFFIGSFLPALAAALINIGLLYETNERFRNVVRAQHPTDTLGAVLQGTVVMFAVFVIAFFSSAPLVYLREVLEGKHWPRWLVRIFAPLQTEKLKQLELELKDVRDRRRRLNDERDRWIDELLTARKTGVGTRLGVGTQFNPRVYQSLLFCWWSGEVISFDDLETTKKLLCEALKKASADLIPSLREAHGAFVDLVDYAIERYDAKYISLYNERQYSFAKGVMAPTTFGNFANAVSAYGLERYGFSLEIGWSRLQKLLQSDAAFSGVVQDVKAQLDSGIMMFWFLAVTTVGWSTWFLLFGASTWLFLAVSVLGPLLCFLVYRVSLSSYLAFADVLRSVIDLYRFKLLTELHLPLPNGPVEERQLWNALRQQSEFGESVDLHYKHSAGALS